MNPLALVRRPVDGTLLLIRSLTAAQGGHRAAGNRIGDEIARRGRWPGPGCRRSSVVVLLVPLTPVPLPTLMT